MRETWIEIRMLIAAYFVSWALRCWPDELVTKPMLDAFTALIAVLRTSAKDMRDGEMRRALKDARHH